MIEDVASIYNAKSCDESSFTHSVKEHVVASEYGWSLEYMRNMKFSEFNKHYIMCLMKKKIEIATEHAFMGVKKMGM